MDDVIWSMLNILTAERGAAGARDDESCVCSVLCAVCQNIEIEDTTIFLHTGSGQIVTFCSNLAHKTYTVYIYGVVFQ